MKSFLEFGLALFAVLVFIMVFFTLARGLVRVLTSALGGAPRGRRGRGGRSRRIGPQRMAGPIGPGPTTPSGRKTRRCPNDQCQHDNVGAARYCARCGRLLPVDD